MAREAVGVLLWKSNGQTVRGSEADSRRGNQMAKKNMKRCMCTVVKHIQS